MDPQQEPSDAYWYLAINEVEAEITRRVKLREDDIYDYGFNVGFWWGACTVFGVLIASEILRIVSDNNKLPAF